MDGIGDGKGNVGGGESGRGGRFRIPHVGKEAAQ